MAKLLKTIFLVLVLSLFTPDIQIAAIFDPERVRILDQDNTSVLARGNVPINRHGLYDPSIVLRQVQELIQGPREMSSNESKVHFDRVIVVSLISSTQSDEQRVLKQQYKYHGNSMGVTTHRPDDFCAGNHRDKSTRSNPTYHFLHRPIVGSWLAWSFLSKLPYMNTWLWENGKPDDGAWAMSSDLKALLHEYRDDHTLIYVHCMRGIDRTGLVSGTYLTRWKHYSPHQVYQANWEVARRQINFPARNALEWVFFWHSRNATPSIPLAAATTAEAE